MTPIGVAKWPLVADEFYCDACSQIAPISAAKRASSMQRVMELRFTHADEFKKYGDCLRLFERNLTSDTCGCLKFLTSIEQDSQTELEHGS